MSLSIVSTEQHIKCKLADTSHCNFEKNLLVSNMNMSGFLQTTGHASWLQKFHNASQTEKCFYNIFFYNFFSKITHIELFSNIKAGRQLLIVYGASRIVKYDPS